MSLSGPVDKKEKSRQAAKTYRKKEKDKIQEMEYAIAALEADRKYFLKETTKLEADNALLRTQVLYWRQKMETAMYEAFPLPQTTTTTTQTSEQASTTDRQSLFKPN